MYQKLNQNGQKLVKNSKLSSKISVFLGKLNIKREFFSNLFNTRLEDKKFSLTGLCIRLTDKISRLKNLLINGKNFVEGESMEDTFIDIANYGIIGLLVGRDKWKK